MTISYFETWRLRQRSPKNSLINKLTILISEFKFLIQTDDDDDEDETPVAAEQQKEPSEKPPTAAEDGKLFKESFIKFLLLNLIFR